MESISDHLVALYGLEKSSQAGRRLQAILARFTSPVHATVNTVFQGRFSERDAILITYGDQLHDPAIPPLHTLTAFCADRLAGIVSGIHLLPFFPYSSDDGFAVSDYRQVDPRLGDWEDIHRLGGSFGLMFDAVINHVSTRSAWFQGFLEGDPHYQDYFITVEGNPDLSQVVRPRALPLLTTFPTSQGTKKVWTTFSADQVDLNYRNPDVLLEVIDTVLFYVRQGAELIRLDAIAYLWKEPGTPCIHLPQTHRVVQLLRAVLDRVAPHVFLITETNVLHRENISYFGDGQNEAQLVYNFALPPLALHTFLSGDSVALRRWAAGLELPSGRTTFFNFLASHDGIGLNPVREILSPAEIDRLVETVQAHRGLVSFKDNPDGSQTPYELNISYFDALSDPTGAEPLERQVDRFAGAHAILFALKGIPGIYFHSLFGSRSWLKGVARTGQKRAINRQKFNRLELEAELDSPGSLRGQVFQRLSRLLQVRGGHPAFHPAGGQQILDAGPGVFALRRISPGGAEQVLCLQNVRSQAEQVRPPDFLGRPHDLLSGRDLYVGEDGIILLEPYQTLWLV